MEYHVLNGDALYKQFPSEKIAGDLITCRECLIEGNLEGDALFDFWDNRAAFIEKNFEEKAGTYNDKILTQFHRILEVHQDSTMNLWFGDDLFCQMNLCFIVYLLDVVGLRENVFLVKGQQNWKDFGAMSEAELIAAYQNRQQMTTEEYELILQCWSAFQQNDLSLLKKLSLTKMDNFPHFAAVIQAHIDRFPTDGQLGRPQRQLLAIQKKLQTDDFEAIFPAFIAAEGIYGFGDSQVQKMLGGLKKDGLI